MAVGDSITAGAEYYRYDLQDLLDSARCNYDMVGTQTDADPVVDGRTFDADHEGYGGWTADELVPVADEASAAEDPQVVLVHVGTNDLYGEETPRSTAEDVRDLLFALRGNRADVQILLAQIIPGTGIEQAVEEYNALLAGVAEEFDDPVSPVTLIDMAAGYDVAEDNGPDGVHPSESGAQKLAQRWFDVLRPAIAPSCDPDL
ncbi:MAG: SGNH/GDSL hydrolase family protein [Actinomycetota bacterium]|nr:SGNH/GDSL hydrolase family protein [Actinomycetota bacterium]